MITRRRAITGLAAMAAGPLLSACGFRPLYGTAADGGRMSEALAAVEIPPVPGRVGQKVRNELIFGLTGGGRPAEAKYQLRIAIRESVADQLVEITGEARGQTYNLDAAFTLVRIADDSVALTGNSVGRAAFDRFPQAFANVRARRDAEDRAARQVAENIKTRIAAYLSTAA